jgi:hypothetical protein
MNYKMIDRLVIQTNAKGDKVQQTQARAIKEDLTEAFIDNFTNAIEGAELLYTAKGTPALSLPNGLIIGVEFTVHKLDTELSVNKPAKPTKK